MTTKWITSMISGVALLGMTLSSTLPASAEQAPDKNGPGVTRVSIVQGSAVVQRGDSGKQVSAVVNAPLLPGDYISTGNTSRAELQFDGSTAVRLGGNVQARITNDDPSNRQLQLADGTIELGLVRDTGKVQVDTPSVTVRATRAGDYRISIGHDGSSWVTTRRGEAEIVTPQGSYTLDSGRTLVARGSASAPSITYSTEVGYDSFDDFNAKRDQTMVAAINASPNLNPDIAGYDNLGAYGQWQDVAGYGQSWIPSQQQGWSPYGSGNWSWEDGYGWTWVGAEPWGWAPYHYGNWYYANGYGWAWMPPAYTASPAWSPALVGFFGFGASFGGPGWGVSLGFGTPGYGYGGFAYPYIGWYPLAPFWPYYPWYPGWAWTGLGWGWGGGGWGGAPVYNITNITNIYRRFPHGGVHGTMVSAFVHGTTGLHEFPVNEHVLTGHVAPGNGLTGHVAPGNEHVITGHEAPGSDRVITGHEAPGSDRVITGNVAMVHGGMAIAPTRDSLGFGGHSIEPVSFSKSFDSPRFAMADHALAARNSFDAQQRTISRAIESNAHNAPVSRDNATLSHGADAARGTDAARHDGAQADMGRRDNATLDTGRHGGMPSDSWSRFNQSRGEEGRVSSVPSGAKSLSAREGTTNEGSRGDRTVNESSRGDRAPSSSWGRFSQQRGTVSSSEDRASYSRSDAYSRGESYGRDSSGGSYGRDSYGSSTGRDAYSRSDYPSYAHSSNPSYAHSSNPSYAHSSYPSYAHSSNPSYAHSSYPSYAHSSNPSYAHGSYPSYAHGSYPSYSHSSYPSYSHGSQPSYSRGSQPSYSHGGGYSAPHASGGGGGGGSHGNGGGRPPR